MRTPLFFYFDLGNVLVYFDHEIACRQLAELAGCEPERIRHEVFSSPLQWEYERGEVSSEEFVARLSERLEVDLPLEQTLEAASAIFHPNQEIIPLLAELKSAGHRLGILSNTCDAHWQWLLRQNYEVMGHWFELCALSFEMGVSKPDLEIYYKSAAMAGVEPQSIFFTDDRLDNIEGARQAGWMAHPFTGVDDLRNHLQTNLPKLG